MCVCAGVHVHVIACVHMQKRCCIGYPGDTAFWARDVCPYRAFMPSFTDVWKDSCDGFLDGYWLLLDRPAPNALCQVIKLMFQSSCHTACP